MSMAVRKVSATVPHSCSTCSTSTDVPVEVTIDRGAISIASQNQDRNPPIKNRLSDLGKTTGGSRQSQDGIPRSIGINIPGNQTSAVDIAVKQPSNSFEQPWEPAYGGASTYTFSGTHSTFARRRMSMNQDDQPMMSPQPVYGFDTSASGQMSASLPIRKSSAYSNGSVLTPITSGTSSPALGSEAFKCVKCSKSYGRQTELNRHSRKHSTFPCRFDTCKHSGEGAFDRKDQLVNHMLKAHGRRE